MLVALGIWDQDKSKLNINPAAEYGKAAANASLRAEDNMAIASLKRWRAAGSASGRPGSEHRVIAAFRRGGAGEDLAVEVEQGLRSP
jgi:hypothetical protein